MPLEVKPGPVLNAHSADETSAFLYQLNTTDGLMKTNLWGGQLSVHNGNDPIHLQRAVKLFLAAEDMLDAAEGLMAKIDAITARNSSFWVSDMHTANETKDEIAAMRAAIKKATE